MNLQLEVAPTAEIELLMDPAGGDMISGKGSGNLRIEYDAFQADTKMYGSYTIESGKYVFNLQDVFRKEFHIESGSTVQWTGSPSAAQVNIRAVYALTASLKTLLDDDELASFSSNTRMTVPVNCVLLLTGNLMTPDIQFDIDLPSSDEGVKQVVRSVISTDEMLTRQVLYLLVFNQFYKEQDQSAGTARGGEFFSLAASTASSQLNNLLSQMINSNKWSFGFDLRRVDEVNMEYQVDLLYQPNDRWIVNGNFGYRDNNNNIEDYNQYITDVDIEYLLTQSGKAAPEVLQPHHRPHGPAAHRQEHPGRGRGVQGRLRRRDRHVPLLLAQAHEHRQEEENYPRPLKGRNGKEKGKRKKFKANGLVALSVGHRPTVRSKRKPAPSAGNNLKSGNLKSEIKTMNLLRNLLAALLLGLAAPWRGRPSPASTSTCPRPSTP